MDFSVYCPLEWFNMGFANDEFDKIFANAKELLLVLILNQCLVDWMIDICRKKIYW